MEREMVGGGGRFSLAGQWHISGRPAVAECGVVGRPGHNGGTGIRSQECRWRVRLV